MSAVLWECRESAGSSETSESDGKSVDIYSKRHFFGSDHKQGNHMEYAERVYISV